MHRRKTYKSKRRNIITMNIDYGDYLLRKVKPKEFTELKKQEADLISSVMKGFNEEWKFKVKGIKATFRYNPDRYMVGIYIEKNGQKQLVQEGHELNESEEAVVGCLYNTLEKRLARLQLPNEKWVDSI